MDDKDVEVEQAARNMPPGIDPNADRALAPGLDRALAPGDMRAIATPPAVRQALERNYVVADVEGRGIVRIVGAVADAPPRAEPHRPETLEQFIARRFDRAEVQPEPAAAPQTEPPPVVTPAEVAASRAVLDGVAAATVTQEPLQEQPGYATARRYASDMYAPDMADAMANEVRDEIVNAVMHNPAEAHDAAPQTEPPQAQARRGRLHPNALYRPEPAGTVSPSPRIQGFWSDDDVRRLQDEMLRIQRENLSLKAEVEKVHHDKVIVRRQLEKLDGLVASLAGKRDEIMAMAERYGKQDEALRRVVDEVFDAVDSASDILLTWNEGDIMQ